MNFILIDFCCVIKVNTKTRKVQRFLRFLLRHHGPQRHKNPSRSQSFIINMVALTTLTFGLLLRSICGQLMHPNSVEFDVPESSPPPATGSCSTTICGNISEEPLGPTARSLRAATCTTTSVDTIRPGAVSNPTNVRNVERILEEQIFEEIFPNRNPAYTYTNLLRAVGKFPTVCAFLHCTADGAATLNLASLNQ